MPKARPSPPVPSNRPLTEYYQVGLELIRLSPPKGKHGSGDFISQFAAERGISADEARKCRRIAEIWTKSEIQKLSQQGVTFSSARRLVSIPSKLRPKWVEWVVAEAPDRKALDARIKKKFGNRRPAAGRKRFDVPRDPEAAFDRVARLATEVTAFLRRVQVQHSLLAGEAQGSIRKAARPQAERAVASISELEEALAGFRKALATALRRNETSRFRT